MSIKPDIQWIKGIKEKKNPTIKLTRSRKGKTGTATFILENPIVFDLLKKGVENIEDLITGVYLTDEEGVLFTKEVVMAFEKGKPEKIQAVFIIQNSNSWDRFMRFMERYRENFGLVFISGCVGFDE
uniref:Photosystem II reaction center Psb28 protein n=1 Tax=Olisthodiscus luteus TaxID=83000 RepID=A0A7U0QGL4_OLILU|nr:photosystem II protein psb28 [Olisthodiscus luteus]QQW50513.1 photosystem II protein psb28 [Olisthodiscus luteus]